MPAPLFDAHNHLAHPDLQVVLAEIETQLEAIGLQTAVVNGTSPADWLQVLKLAARSTRVLPAVGLHPWFVNDAPADWQQQFLRALDAGARAVGEVGLDRWIEGYHLPAQLEAFRWQVAQATTRNLPLSIHCLKAMGLLLETLTELQLPARGFHLHAYNGAAEQVAPLAQLGAYFSFNCGQLKPQARRVRAAIRAVPLERLLIETDAPDMLPPPELREFELAGGNTALNHPANIRRAYHAIAELRQVDPDHLATQVARNFERFFGSK